MNKTLQKTVSALLCLLLLLAALPSAALSAEIVDSGSYGANLTWTLDAKGLLTVSGAGEIPYRFVDNDPYLQKHKYDIYRIRVETGIETIGDSAFIGCLYTDSVSLPDGLKTIRSYAFWNAGIKLVSIPDSVTSLGRCAFSECHYLEAAYLGRGLRELPERLFYNNGNLAEVYIGKKTVRISEGAFSRAEKLKTVYYEGTAAEWSAMVIEAQNENLLQAAHCFGCTEQRYGSFQEEIYLEYLAYTVKWGRAYVTRVRDISGTVVIPETLGGFPVYGIDAYAANFCPEITVFELPSSLAEIGLPFADQCFGLRRIEVSPDNPYYCSINGVLFNKDASVLIRVPCESETESRDKYDYPLYRVPSSVVRIEERAFSRHYGRMAVSIPAGTVDIAETAFAENERLLYFDVSAENPVYTSCDGVLFDKEIKTLLSAPGALVRGSETVRAYTLPDTVDRICVSAFEHSLLEKVVFPASLRVIENFAFRSSRLEEVVFQGEVEEIGSQTFYDCASLASVTMPTRIFRRLGEQAFYRTPWFNAQPDGPIYINNAFYTWKGNFPEKSVFSVKDGTTVLADECLQGNESVECVTSLDLPDCIEYIGRGVFWGFKGLTEVRLPANTREIGSYAFYECNGLKKVWLNDRLEKICSNAFFCFFSQMDIEKTFYPGTRTEFDYITVEKENTALLANLICLGDHTTHTWDAGVPLSVPNCMQAGKTLYTCTVCLETKTEEIPALSHDLVSHAAKAPTCTAIGWDTYDTCSRCDYTTYEEISALGHDYVEHAAQAATCIEKGWKAYRTCSRCDYTTYEELPALGHDYGDWLQTQAPSCTEKGEEKRTCSRCDATETRTVDALTHKFTVLQFDATSHWYACANSCGMCTEKETHSFGEWITDVPATAEQEGTAHRICVSCKYKETKTLPKEIEAYLFGDVNHDGMVTAADARLALRKAVELEHYEEGSYEFFVSDVDFDGIVTAADARLILRAAVNLEDPNTWLEKYRVLVGDTISELSLSFGDVDRNTRIEPADARLALRISLGLLQDGTQTMDEVNKLAADVDVDGEVNPGDARLILRKSLGLDVASEGWNDV